MRHEGAAESLVGDSRPARLCCVEACPVCLCTGVVWLVSVTRPLGGKVPEGQLLAGHFCWAGEPFTCGGEGGVGAGRKYWGGWVRKGAPRATSHLFNTNAWNLASNDVKALRSVPLLCLIWALAL